jgi:predicted permease
VRNLPGVDSAAVASNLPFSWSSSSMLFYLEDQPIPEAGKFPTASKHSVSAEYFKALGIPVLRGRVFDGTEPMPNFPPGVPMTPENLKVLFKGVQFQAVVSKSMAERHWPNQDPIGKRFRLGYPDMHLPVAEIIGVVGDITQSGLEKGPIPEYYLSQRQFSTPEYSHLVIRTLNDPAGIVAAVRAALKTEFPDHPVTDVRLMVERMEEQVSGRKFNLRLFVFFAGVALLLALIGLYGVLAYVVSQHTREIGIRMALGASQSDVLRDILRRGMLLVVPGLILGGVAAWIASRYLQSQLYSITRNDATSYVVSAGLLLLAAIIACLLPARRATKVNPIEALRTE